MEKWDEDLSQLWEKLLKYFDIAERFIKILETDIEESNLNEKDENSGLMYPRGSNGFEYDGVLFPPINQLRYTCRDLLMGYYKMPNTEKGKDLIKEAIRHAKRAAWDSLEIALWIRRKRINAFRDHYERYITDNIIPDWNKEVVIPVDNVFNFIKRVDQEDKESLRNNHVDEDGSCSREIKEETIDVAVRHYEKLLEIKSLLESKRSMLNDIMSREKKIDLLNLFIGAILGALIGFVLSNLGTIFDFISTL